MKKLNMTIEEIKDIVEKYELIKKRAEEVAVEIGLTCREFDKVDREKTDFNNYDNTVIVAAYNSHYDMYDSVYTSFPYKYLIEDEECHKDVYRNEVNRKKEEDELKIQKQKEEKERQDWKRLKQKFGV